MTPQHTGAGWAAPDAHQRQLLMYRQTPDYSAGPSPYRRAMTQSIHRPVVLFAALCCAVAACGSQSSDGKAGESSAASAKSSATSAPIDACSLLSAEDISALLGTTVQGKSTSINPEVADCKWENPANYESVSLEIGNPGTAPDNTLPPADPAYGFTPGPDGMRYTGSGQVEFPAGNRSNTVQVAVLKMSAEEVNAASVGLARKVGPKIPS
jgi:hypothetical protein